MLDYLSLDHGDKKNESNFDALNENSSQAAVPVVQLGKNDDIDEGLVVSMSEIGELSEKYEGEDEIIDVFVPYLHVIVPLKTVEAGVKMYNTIGNAMKTSAETFVRELASAKKTYARVRPNKMSSLHSLKSLRRARSKSAGQSKVFSSTDNLLAKKESNIHISNENDRTNENAINDEMNLTPIEKGMSIL